MWVKHFATEYHYPTKEWMLRRINVSNKESTAEQLHSLIFNHHWSYHSFSQGMHFAVTGQVPHILVLQCTYNYRVPHQRWRVLTNITLFKRNKFFRIISLTLCKVKNLLVPLRSFRKSSPLEQHPPTFIIKHISWKIEWGGIKHVHWQPSNRKVAHI